MNILEEIVLQRKKDIGQKTVSLGFEIPKERTRKVTPFLPRKGAILEIKRASPSKGDIALSLDPKKTARIYASAGASAISVLTEERWFKGNLNDLMGVCESVDEYAEENSTTPPAILRKDFLLSAEEIEVSYRCGADAVLLIARILDKERIVAMAKKCRELGITSLIELRLKEDLEKLSEVVKNVSMSGIVLGVNARDLRNFTIDMLTPSALLSEIRSIAGDDARVVFESGIRTARAASFAGSLGFSAMLLGEAAAKNPDDAGKLVSAFVGAQENQNSRAWTDYADRLQKKRGNDGKMPFVKICGITNEKDAVKAASSGADFLGFIFYDKSPRKINPDNLPSITAKLKEAGLRDRIRLVGVIVDTDSKDSQDAVAALKKGDLDFIQLHRTECFRSFGQTQLPHYAAVNVSGESDLDEIDEIRLAGEPRILIDAKVGEKIGGTGERVADMLVEKVSKKTKLWLAGGITPENVIEIIEKFNPELIDVASGVEASPGIKDHEKISSLFEALRKRR